MNEVVVFHLLVMEGGSNNNYHLAVYICLKGCSVISDFQETCKKMLALIPIIKHVLRERTKILVTKGAALQILREGEAHEK